jgi:SpoVK/Ycf46/Vps4 family AAA+-type ATPase
MHNQDSLSRVYLTEIASNGKTISVNNLGLPPDVLESIKATPPDEARPTVGGLVATLEREITFYEEDLEPEDQEGMERFANEVRDAIEAMKKLPQDAVIIFD